MFEELKAYVKSVAPHLLDEEKFLLKLKELAASRLAPDLIYDELDIVIEDWS